MLATAGAADLQRNSSGIRRQSSSLRRPSFSRQASDRSPSRDGLTRADSGQGRMASPELGQVRGGSPSSLPQPQEQDLQAAWELEVWKNAEEVCMHVSIHMHVCGCVSVCVCVCVFASCAFTSRTCISLPAFCLTQMGL